MIHRRIQVNITLDTICLVVIAVCSVILTIHLT